MRFHLAIVDLTIRMSPEPSTGTRIALDLVMRLSRTCLLAAFALTSSCGGSNEPTSDQVPAVSVSPRSEDTQTPSAEPAPVEPTPSWSFHGFHGAFAVFSQGTPNGTTTTRTVALKTLETSQFEGRPVFEDESFDERPYAMQESPSGVAKQLARTAAKGRYLLLERKGAVEVADLTRKSIVARYDGDAQEARFDDVGQTLVVRSAGELHLLAWNGAKRADIALGGAITSELEWSARGARFYAGEETGWQFFDRGSFSEWSAAKGATVLRAGKDGSVLMLRGSSLETWMVGERAPRGTIRAEALAASHPDEDFFESEEREDLIVYGTAIDQKVKGQMHRVFDFHVASWSGGEELVFRGIGDCGQSPERIVSIDDDTIVTDVSCSLGCPSEAYTPEHAVYDRKTGTLLRQESGETEPAYTSVQGDASLRFEEDLEKLGLAAAQVLPLPGASRRYLLAREGALVVVRGGKVRARLENSAEIAVTDAVLSHDGGLVALKAGAGFRVWNTSSGAEVFSIGE